MDIDEWIELQHQLKKSDAQIRKILLNNGYTSEQATKHLASNAVPVKSLKSLRIALALVIGIAIILIAASLFKSNFHQGESEIEPVLNSTSEEIYTQNIQKNKSATNEIQPSLKKNEGGISVNSRDRLTGPASSDSTSEQPQKQTAELCGRLKEKCCSGNHCAENLECVPINLNTNVVFSMICENPKIETLKPVEPEPPKSQPAPVLSPAPAPQPAPTPPTTPQPAPTTPEPTPTTPEPAPTPPTTPDIPPGEPINNCVSGQIRECKTSGKGQCSIGTQTCLATKDWGACESTISPSSELCDNLDNNCDGAVDENLKRLTNEKGACIVNTETCTSGTYTPNKEYTPKTETCNNIDDDCNGLVDDKLTKNLSQKGACIVNTETCKAGAYFSDNQYTPKTETCNNIDDDCDGAVDENLKRLTNEKGACIVNTETCTSGTYTPNKEYTPKTETCNNIDDDCDGAVDENLKRLTNEKGACIVNTETCTSGTYTPNKEYTPKTETCNNIDDNCDGAIDEGGICLVSSESTQVKVLSMSYFPVVGENIDGSITGQTTLLSSMRSKVSSMISGAVGALTKGTIYKGYKNPSATPSLQYTVIDSKEFLKAMPVSSNKIPWNPSAFRPDYGLMLTSDVGICDYVDNQGVQEVWIWGYHFGAIEPVESDMSMGKKSSAFFNRGSYGDISNSEGINDLPVCDNTYTLYNYNYNRRTEEVVHNHGHQLENLFAWVNSDLFWKKWVGGQSSNVIGNPGCGDTHHPPNSAKDYDYFNPAAKQSDCEDWNPAGTGTKTAIDCTKWGCSESGELQYYIWWMQNIPGKSNGLILNEKPMRDWWEFAGDFDQAAAKGRSFS